MNACRFAALDSILIPDTALHLTYMSRAHHKHTKSRLTDSAANGKRKLTVKEHLMEGKLASVVASALVKLTCKRLLVNSDTHRRDLEGSFKHLVIEEDIAV